MKKATGYRQEHDSIGERAVPEQAYYGIQTLRAVENFCITRQRTHPALIESMVQVKKAAALANLAAGELDEKRAKAIAAACDEILGGALHDEFIVDPVQGGAGTSLNMNANEVIANRAIELLGGEKGNYALVSPNDHVNLGQSTNDVFPSAGRMAALAPSSAASASSRSLRRAPNTTLAPRAASARAAAAPMPEEAPVMMTTLFSITISNHISHNCKAIIESRSTCWIVNFIQVLRNF